MFIIIHTSSAFSCPFLNKTCWHILGLSLLLRWMSLALEKQYSGPFDQNKNINITKSWSISYLVVGHSPDWIWWKAGCRGHVAHHDRWKEGLCDGPWWGNTGPEWPPGQYHPTAYNQTTEFIKLAVNYWTNPVMHPGPRNVNALQDIPGICPKYPLTPQEFSRSGSSCRQESTFLKEVSPYSWVIGGIKTPKSCKEQKKKQK